MKMVNPAMALIGGAILAASMSLNIILARTSLNYYWLLNKTRLDPFGLLEIPDQPHNRTGKRRVVIIGDSRAGAWPQPLDSQTAEFINRGVSGQTTAQILGRFQPHVADLEPDVVLIQAGINDLKTIPLFPERESDIIEQCKANVRELVSRSVDAGAKVVVTTIIPGGQVPLARIPFWPEKVDQAVGECNDSIKQLAADQVTVFDAAKIVAGRNGHVQPHYQLNFLHLNSKGYETLNRKLATELNAMLK